MLNLPVATMGTSSCGPADGTSNPRGSVHCVQTTSQLPEARDLPGSLEPALVP